MSLPAPTRRRFLRAAGVSATTALPGCAFGGGSGRLPTVTPAPVPTDEPTPTTEPTPPSPSPDDVAFEVTVLDGFTRASPARLAIAFRNTGSQHLTGVGNLQHILPFVDDDYAGVDESGRLGVFLAPDDTSLRIQPPGTPGGPVDQFLPDAPTGGCWTLPFDWPAVRGVRPSVLYTVSVPPGERVRHDYGLYYIDACRAGRFTFESRFDLANTDPPLQGRLHRTRLGFDLTVTQAETIRVDVHEPRVGPQGPAD